VTDRQTTLWKKSVTIGTIAYKAIPPKIVLADLSWVKEKLI